MDQHKSATTLWVVVPNEQALQSVTAWQRWQRRAYELSWTAEDQAAALAQLLGLPMQRFPQAALMAAAAGRSELNDYWLLAQPVQVAVRGHDVILCGQQDLCITLSQAKQWVADFNKQWEKDGWWLHAPTPMTWYLRAPQQTPVLAHQSLTGAIDCSVGVLREALSSWWLRQQAEWEMWWHSQSLPFQDVWLSGGGYYPAAAGEYSASKKLIHKKICWWGSDLLLKGLAQWRGECWYDQLPGVKQWQGEIESGVDHVVVYKAAQTVDWSQELIQWLSLWRNKGVQRLCVVVCGGKGYRLLSPRQRWWRY